MKKQVKSAVVKGLTPLEREYYEGEVQPYRKTDYKPMMIIPQDINVVLIKSLVMSRLDYSNGLLYGLPKCTVSGCKRFKTQLFLDIKCTINMFSSLFYHFSHSQNDASILL